MSQTTNHDSGLLTFGGHLEVLRKMLFRIVVVVVVIGCVIFCFKSETFAILLAPHRSDFVTFKLIGRLSDAVGWSIRFDEYDIKLISTELSAQFMTHISVSCMLASPYIMLVLFLFVSPALYERERKYSYLVAGVISILFVCGLLMSYFVLFPISFQFLANYQVDKEIESTITLSSYISTFATLTFLMGIVFQFPVLAFVLGRMGVLDSDMLCRYRAYAFVLIMIVAAMITPPDLATLVLVTIPLYGLYEVSILILKRIQHPISVEDTSEEVDGEGGD